MEKNLKEKIYSKLNHSVLKHLKTKYNFVKSIRISILKFF